MRILVTAPYPDAQLLELESWFGTVIYQPWIERGAAFSASELTALINETRADALITELDELTQDVIQSWKPKPKFVAICRATPSTIHVQALREQDIPLFTAPTRNIQAVAELLLGNIISFYRHASRSEKWLKEGNWTDWLYPYKEFRGQQLYEKKVGIVGLGAVGRRVAALLEAFSCDIAYYDPYVSAESFPQYQPKSLEEIFSTSEIVSIHLPSTPETKGLISREILQLLPAGSLFVNTSRASVVDTAALFDILENNKTIGAVIDVFDNEPPEEQDMRLIRLENVLATPHIAGSTEEVVLNHARLINNALAEWKASWATP